MRIVLRMAFLFDSIGTNPCRPRAIHRKHDATGSLRHLRLGAIDASAKERGLTRSAFLASAARKKIEAA
jgi:hypothetical protein